MHASHIGGKNGARRYRELARRFAIATRHGSTGENMEDGSSESGEETNTHDSEEGKNK